MKLSVKVFFLIFLAVLLPTQSILAQTSIQDPNEVIGQKIDGIRFIRTGVPLLTVTPEARGGALGEAGVASTPDLQSMHYNAAKYAFLNKDYGVSISYSPWLRNLVNDINLSYLTGFFKLNNRNSFATSLRYFSLGSINFYDVDTRDLGTFHPNEFAIDGAYIMQLSNEFSMSVTGRYIRSDLTQGQNIGTQTSRAANAGSVDLGFYFQKEINSKNDEHEEFALGAQISNLGSKISYTDETLDKLFLPANLRLGGRYSKDIDAFNKFSLLLDFNKLLVPTPPITGDNHRDIVAGKNPNVGVFQGAIQSFYDAPNGFSEEMQEIMISTGAEYWYSNTIAVRAGYFHESDKKGGRKFITLGAALRFNVFTIDLAYLFTVNQTANALNNTLRFTLGFDFGKDK